MTTSHDDLARRLRDAYPALALLVNELRWRG